MAVAEEDRLDLLPEAALEVDGTGHVVAINRLAAALFGPEPEHTAALAEAVGHVPGFAAWLRGSGDDRFRGRFQAHRPNGVPLTIELAARRLASPAGTAARALCLLLEPDREQVASEAQRYFDVAFDSAPIGMALFNTDGEYVRVNAALCSFLGRPERELIGRRDQEFTHPDDRQADVDAAWRILRGELDTWQCEKRFVRPDGTVVWAIANLSFLRDGDGNPMSWVGQFQDITARKALEADLGRDIARRKRIEEQLAVAHAAAVQASRLKSEFLANMSHEIRTPLNGVIGMCGLLLGTELEASQREYAEMARRSGETLLELINDILDFSKIEAGKLELERSTFDLRVLTEEVAELFAPQAHQKGVEVVVTAAPDLPAAVSGDPGRVRQVLTNLVSNAVKFTDAGEVAIDVSAAAGAPDLVRFTVRDTGIGIPAAHRERVFDSFTQAEVSTTSRYGGTGLGLAISKRLTELMGGTIGLTSEPGRGSTFWFTVRLEAGAAAAEPSPSPGRRRLPDVAPELSGARVLVAEDNPVNQRVAAAMLSRLGFRVDVVGDGREAIAALQRAPYVAVLMDCQMPDMNGYQATAEIRRREGAGRRTPIVALTASALKGDEERCLAAGMDAYLSKPVRIEALADVLNRVALAGNGSSARPAATPAAGAPSRPEGQAVGPAEDGRVDEEVLAELELGPGNDAGARLLHVFVSETGKRVARLERAAADGDADEVARTAHSIRGSAGAFGARRLSEIAGQVEEAWVSGDRECAARLLPGVKVEFEAFRAILHARFPLPG